MFIPLSDIWDGAWFTVGPPVSLLPLLGFLDGGVFFASIEDVLRDVPPFDDPFDLRVPIEDLMLKEQKHSSASEERVQERDLPDTQTGNNLHTERGLLSPVSRKQSENQFQVVDH